MAHKMSDFARRIMEQKYSHTKPDGSKETWDEISYRVATNVMEAIGYKRDSEETMRVYQMISSKKFVPGGRYLYATGRDFHQVNNCFSGDTQFITKDGVVSFAESVNSSVQIRNRFGEWEEAQVKSFGEQDLWKITLANGEEIATTSGHLWWQKDGNRVKTTELKEVLLGKIDKYPDMDNDGIRNGIIFGDGFGARNKKTGEKSYSKIIFVNPKKDRSLVSFFVNEERTVTVGFGAKIKINTIRETKAGTVVSLQPLRYKFFPKISSCAPEYARGFIAGVIATDGHVGKSGSVTISCEGIKKAKEIAKFAVLSGCIVTSTKITNRINPFNNKARELCTVSIKPGSAPILLPSHIDNRKNRKSVLRNMRIKVVSVEPMNKKELVYCVVAPKTESFTLANGVVTSNCLLMRAVDSREGWSELLHNSSMSLMTGAGIGIEYSDVRPKGSIIKKTGGLASGPISLMEMINEAGRHIQQGGNRRSAIWSGLNWSHGDIYDFIKKKDWSQEIKALKQKDFNFPAPLDMTNISVGLDDTFFEAYYNVLHPLHTKAKDVYWKTVSRMLKDGEPGFSINLGANHRESLRNACTELSSEDDSDICNIGSINLSQIENTDEMTEVVEYSTLFLLAGTIYSQVPYEKVRNVREKNRRLGLGLMGIHEWLLMNGHRYEQNKQLEQYMEIYASSGEYANQYADKLGISRPVKTRAIAPTGTIGLISETTTGIEPVFAVALKRRYLKGEEWMYEYIVDPTAKKLIDSGTPKEHIEDSYMLSKDVERRLSFQTWLQTYVDHGISSTINMPAWGSEFNNSDTVEKFGSILLKYLPKLRGITVYPDGSRGGQPLTPVDIDLALSQTGQVFTEGVDLCDITKGGSCGS